MHTRGILLVAKKNAWPKVHDSCFRSLVYAPSEFNVRLNTPVRGVQVCSYLHIAASDLPNAELRDQWAADGHTGERQSRTQDFGRHQKYSIALAKGLKMDLVSYPFVLATICRKHGVV